MRKSKLFAFLCAVGTWLSTFGEGVSISEALSVGDVIAVDVGATIGSAANFNTFLGTVDGTVPAETIKTVVKWNDGITVADNVSVTLSGVRGFGTGEGATSWVGIEDDIYLDANAMDQAYSDSSISLTFSGLDNSLRYNVRAYVILNDGETGTIEVTDGTGTRISASGVLRSTMYAATTLEDAGTVFSALSTDGSGNIVVTSSSSTQWSVLTAVVLEAVPAIGIKATQDGTTLSWTVKDEKGINKYQVVDAKAGEILETMIAGEGSYTTTVLEGVETKIVVVNNYDCTQNFTPTRRK